MLLYSSLWIFYILSRFSNCMKHATLLPTNSGYRNGPAVFLCQVCGDDSFVT